MIGVGGGGSGVNGLKKEEGKLNWFLIKTAYPTTNLRPMPQLPHSICIFLIRELLWWIERSLL